MSEVEDTLMASFYALFAFEQDLRLDELAVGAQSRTFPATATNTPEWFAAAAESVDLLAMAPELRVLPADGPEEAVTAVEDLDIISVYAPEMAAQRRERAQAQAAAEAAQQDSADVPRGPSSFDLLRELNGIDE